MDNSNNNNTNNLTPQLNEMIRIIESNNTKKLLESFPFIPNNKRTLKVFEQLRNGQSINQ